METVVKVLVGDILEMKKQHPCGCKLWEVLRIGADFRIRCMECNRELMLPRARVMRSARKIIRGEQTILL